VPILELATVAAMNAIMPDRFPTEQVRFKGQRRVAVVIDVK